MHEAMITPWIILPFGILLVCIAVFPLIVHHWWEKWYPAVALALGAITLGYYVMVVKDLHSIAHSMHEYVSFICLVGSLFVVSGGIHITVKGESKPWNNVVLLAIGGVLANFVGTTGASMLLIRPYLRANKYRLTAFHVVFFIFIVSNVGGALTPVGDPPLYLGYLKGIPFFWTTTNLFIYWVVAMAWLLAIFYILDRRNFLRAPEPIRELETANETWKIRGTLNFLWLGLVLGALFINRPIFLREGLMILAVVLSLITTHKDIHAANDFTWAPIKEVAILFLAIFITMVPALSWLKLHGGEMGISSAGSYYWATGVLSALLDNAPTYLNFLSAADGLFISEAEIQQVHAALSQGAAATVSPETAQVVDFLKTNHPDLIQNGQTPREMISIGYLLTQHSLHVVAISIAAVFFGACTYIGNGPNFMVKSIAHHSGAKTPSFPGYIFKYSFPILLPLLAFIWLVFFLNKG
jgi:Na+/H+ antiporter NhaD/arsenite permease-like protein